jgi:GAF domain-containing protein
MMFERKEQPDTSRSLTTVLVRALFGLALAALLIAYIPPLLFFIQAGNQALAGEQQLIAQDAANTVRNFVSVIFDVVETAARLGNPVSTSRQEQETILANLLGLQPAFRQLAFLNAQGEELVGISRRALDTRESALRQLGPDWFAQLQAGERYISPVYVDEATSEPMMVIAVPSQDVFGDFQGVLLAEVNLKFMWDLIDRLEVGESGLAYVVDGEGDLLALGDVSRVLRGENVSQVALVNSFVEDPVPAGEAVTMGGQGINDFRVIGTYVSLGTPDWAVVTEVPVQEATAPLIRRILISLAVILLVAASVGGGAVYLGRQLASPVLDLTATARRIAEGELEQQAALEGPAEVVDLARAFNAMTAQLRETLAGLEQRVVERTQDLLTAAEVAATSTRVLSMEELLPQVVELVRERFDLYYVGLFLKDRAGEYAILRAGTGEAGQAMLARGHRLAIGGDSMIGRCVLTGEPDIQLDVGEAAVHFSNPDLPETRSELALPLLSGEEVIGAMTVQSEQEAFFAEEDVTVLQTVADQIANAVRNARLFQQLEESLIAERRAYGEIAREAWLELLQTESDLGFLSDRQETRPAGEVWRPEMRDAMRVGDVVVGEERNTLAIPIRVRDQVVGVIDGRKPVGTAWTSEEIDVLSAMTEQLNTALESARLYEETRRRAARERVVGDISSQMRSSTSLENMLRMAVQELGQRLALDEVVLELMTEPGEIEAERKR